MYPQNFFDPSPRPRSADGGAAPVAASAAAEAPHLAVVSGPPGSGRTTAARSLVARRGFVAREFGALDYAAPAALARSLRALAVCGGRGGLLVQLGAAAGVGVIFDDLAGVRSSAAAAHRVVRTFARSRAGPRLLVVCVVDGEARPAGYRAVHRAARLRIRLPGGPPTPGQLAWIARDVGLPVLLPPAPGDDGNGDGDGDGDPVRLLRADERTDLRAARAGLLRVRREAVAAAAAAATAPAQVTDADAADTAGTSGTACTTEGQTAATSPTTATGSATSGTVLAEGSGRRDVVWDGTRAPDLARAACTRGASLEESARAAATAPRTVAALHAANLHRAVRCPRERVAFARSQALAAMCGARAFDDEAQRLALWTGALALRLVGRRAALDGRQRLVASKLLSLQARYDGAIRAGSPDARMRARGTSSRELT